MKRFLYWIICAVLVPAAATAWENTMEWRFLGSDIAGITVIDPEIEDPVVLEIALSNPDFGDTLVIIESDDDISACVETLRFSQGNPQITLVLTSHLNAQTMNGVLLAQCSMR